MVCSIDFVALMDRPCRCFCSSWYSYLPAVRECAWKSVYSFIITYRWNLHLLHLGMLNPIPQSTHSSYICLIRAYFRDPRCDSSHSCFQGVHVKEFYYKWVASTCPGLESLPHHQHHLLLSYIVLCPGVTYFHRHLHIRRKGTYSHTIALIQNCPCLSLFKAVNISGAGCYDCCLFTTM